MVQPNEMLFHISDLTQNSDFRLPGPSRQLDVQRKKLEYDKLQLQQSIELSPARDRLPTRFDRVRLRLSNTLMTIASVIRPSERRHWDTAIDYRRS